MASCRAVSRQMLKKVSPAKPTKAPASAGQHPGPEVADRPQRHESRGDEHRQREPARTQTQRDDRAEDTTCALGGRDQPDRGCAAEIADRNDLYKDQNHSACDVIHPGGGDSPREPVATVDLGPTASRELRVR